MILNTHQLARYLMLQIHGVKLPRKPAKRETGRGPARSWRYRAWIRSLPCAVCGIEPAGEAAHTGTDGGIAIKSSDFSCIPLCENHHRCGSGSYHRLGRAGFEKRWGLDIAELVKRLNRLWWQGRRAA